MEIEKKIIKLIESIDKIMDTWDKLTIRRTLLVTFSILMFLQMIITTIILIFDKSLCEPWVEVMRIEFVAWGIMIEFYFYVRGKNGGEE